MLRYAASLEAGSEHPIAAGIVEKAETKGLELLKVEKFKAVPGKGVEGIVDGKDVVVASPYFLKELGLYGENADNQQLWELREQVLRLSLLWLIEKFWSCWAG